MQATAPAGTIIKIQGIAYELVNDTLVEGGTPFIPNRQFPHRTSHEKFVGIGPVSDEMMKYLTDKYGDLTKGYGFIDY